MARRMLAVTCRGAVAFVLGLLLLTPVGAAAQPVIYLGAHLIDGTGGPLRRDMAIVTDGERITAIVPARKLAIKGLGAVEVVDLAGLYVLPGLIDSHEHLRPGASGKAMMRRDLYSGITAVRDLANDLRDLQGLVAASRSGEIPGPDIYYAALMGGPSLFENPRMHGLSTGFKPGIVPWAQAIADDADLPAAVARAKGTGATAIKIYANLPPPLVAAIAAEAHRQGMLVWAHAAVFPTKPRQVVEAGVDAVSHVCDLAYQVANPPPQTIGDRFPVDFEAFAHGDNAELTALFAEMRRRGVILDATNRTYAEGDERPAGGRPRNCTAELAARLTAQAFRQGVDISTGTDGFAPPQEPFPPLYDEIGFLARKVRMPPAQVIRSATLVGAMAAGRQAEMGTIEAGKLANLMVVRANPLDDIEALRTVVLTVKRGRRYPRADYQPAAKGGD